MYSIARSRLVGPVDVGGSWTLANARLQNGRVLIRLSRNPNAYPVSIGALARPLPGGSMRRASILCRHASQVRPATRSPNAMTLLPPLVR
ncbi:hypothetical protein SPBR_04513 [Sporothrix brasiliensis 5110]|uniref:Uncharacterized protein n=1 Tax=Sporothrix brasiliensis 5110 TaxID=1398154 RepID=A0A0C2J920_9PEZI|nr:uncharacterized protein SPBR_04513 [Sporothrix brasiliensis 5110]KIH93477.1 hypothetical protein SPBR_04513 [Sporothrix brasiliensis 5110]